jgi:hypothetical protein
MKDNENNSSKQKQLRASNWKNISTDDVYQLSMSEFKGATIQALQDIREDIKDIKKDAQVRGWISFGIGGAAGLIASILTTIGTKH